MPTALLYVILFVLILLSSFFSMSEIALNSVNQLKLKKASEAGDRNATRAIKNLENINETVYSILFGNDFVNIFSTSLATIVGETLFSRVQGNYVPLLVSVTMFLIILTFGEVLPKIIGLRFNYFIARYTSLPLRILVIVLKPLIFVISKFVNLLTKPFIGKHREDTTITDEDLIEMVDTIKEEGVINENQENLLKSAIEFCDTTVYEIMTPRVEIFALNIDGDNEAIYNSEELANYSRIPVYKESIDNIIGIVKTKAILKKLLQNEKIDLRKLMSKPIYVPKTKQISSMLRDFKDERNHIAIIIDEFGGTEGIVTMEDIVEELVGEIWDETDEIEEEFEQKSENIFVVDGSMNIYDFFELVGLEEEIDSDFTTVSGFCTDFLERFAKKGDSFDFKNLTIEILEVDDFIIEKIRVIVNEVNEDDEE